MAAHNAMTPGNLSFGFSPALSQALAGSSPHPHLKKSPYSAALAPSLSSSGTAPNFESPSASKYLSLLAGDSSLHPGAGANGVGNGANGVHPGIGAGEDKEFAKLKRVLRILRSRPGRITEEGVKRLARRAGLQFHKDNTSVKGVQTLIISGDIVVVDIDLKDNQISRVNLSFAETPGPAAELADRAAKILQKTLAPDGYAITSSLTKFADNIERFARADRLSALPFFNCFSAVTGLYVSLAKIWEKESAGMGELEAMCKGMGRPGMHVRGKVGFGIDYWKERRTISSSKKGKAKGDDESGKYWRVLIDVYEIPNEAYITPVRSSEDWVSDGVLKQRTDGLFAQDGLDIDWIEPPLNNYDSVTDPELLQRLNNTRFVAKLDPPLVIGVQDEMEIMSAAGVTTLSTVPLSSLDTILCPKANSKEGLKNKRTVYMSSEESSDHRYTLNTLRPAYGRVLEEIPFSHPKQLAVIFQILRKYAIFQSIFHSAFPADLTTKPSQSLPTNDLLDVHSFMMDDKPDQIEDSAIPIDVSVNSLPLGLSLLFPYDKERLSQIEINIMANAELEILAATGNISTDNEQLKKVLEITEDLGILVEYMKKKDASAARNGTVIF